jgi:hypothetical protein
MVNDGALAREMVASAAAAAGVEITPELRPLLERVGLRVLEGVFREEAAREAGTYKKAPDDDPSLAAFHLRSSAPSAASTPSAAPAGMVPPALPAAAPELGETTATPVEPSAPAHPATASAELLSSLIEPFFGKRTRDKIRQQGMAQERTTLRLFFEILGDRPAQDYRRQDITTFLDALRRLPSTYGKSPKDRELVVEELIARANTTNAPRLTDKTVKRHRVAVPCQTRDDRRADSARATEDQHELVGNHCRNSR